MPEISVPDKIITESLLFVNKVFLQRLSTDAKNVMCQKCPDIYDMTYISLDIVQSVKIVEGLIKYPFYSLY